MPQISWILYRERVVGRGSPSYVDVDNRPLRQLVQLHGWDPDDASFSGLHHMPLGAYLGDIFEHVPGSGVTVHANATLNDDVTFVGGRFTLTANADFDIHLATHKLNIDGGDLHLTGGRFFGDIDTVDIKTALTIDAGVTFTINAASTFNGNIDAAFLNLHSATTLNILFPYTTHTIAGVPWASLYSAVPGLEIIETFTGPGGWRIRSNSGSNDMMEITNMTTAPVLKVYFTGGIDFSAIGETGWSLGSGGTQKGGLVAGTSTLTTTQQVVNSLVAALLTKHKLLQP